MSLKHSPPEKTLRDVLIEPSQHIAAAIHAQPFQCALNAWRAFIEFPDLFLAGGRLVEGWFVVEQEGCVVMNEHVWCEVDDHIVDPSVLLLVPTTTPVFYFIGLARTYAETEALEGEFFPYVRFDGLHGKDGLGHLGYKAAREAARRKVYSLAMRKQPPKGMQFLTAQDLEVLAQGREEEARPPIIEGEPLDLRLSLTVSRYLPAVLGQCWQNARNALLQMPNEFFSAFYVEGWLVGQWADAIRVTEHGWIWTPRTGIVDPTLVLKQAVPIRLAYFSGFQLAWTQIQAYTTEALPLARQQQHQGGLDYQEACQIALKRGEQLAWQTGLPLFAEPGRVTALRGIGNALLVVEETTWEFPVPPPSHTASLLHERENGGREP